jgi:hypothetical protein
VLSGTWCFKQYKIKFFMENRMKFQLKALVAALAIVAAVPAQAAIELAGTGDSSLVLTLVDSTNVVSATFDLGSTFSTFDRTANQSWDLKTVNYIDAWNAFSAAASSAKQWGVYMGDGNGTAAGSQQRFVTAATPTSLNTQIINTSLQQSTTLFDGFLTASNNIAADGTSILNNHQQVANGSNFVSLLPAVNAASGLSVNAYGTSGKIANASGDTNGAFDTDLFAWTITRSTTIGANNATIAQVNVAGFNPFFNLSSNGVLTYTASNAAPIPEPETYGMLLAGLGMIGFVARRRKSA